MDMFYDFELRRNTKMTTNKIITAELYKLCNDNRLFTCGSISQYEKMFELASNGVTAGELAMMLYLCSDKKYTLAAINKVIAPLFGGAE